MTNSSSTFEILQTTYMAHLIALDPPDLNHPTLQFPEAEFVLFEKDGAAVGTGVFGQIDARRVWLRHKVPVVAEGGEGTLN